jgi:hypothetical protein
MFSTRRWSCLAIATLLLTSVGCSHQQLCTTCKSHVTTHPPSCGCGANTVMNVMVDPSGPPGTYVLMPGKTPVGAGTAPAKSGPITLPPNMVSNPEMPKIIAPTRIYPPQQLAPAVVAKAQPGETHTVAKPTEAPSGGARYDHAKDHSWLMGKLEYLYSKKVWRVRYSPPEVDDELGGCVTLVGIDPALDNFKSGQMVRVDGVLVDPDSRQLSPAYQVHGLKPLE